MAGCQAFCAYDCYTEPELPRVRTTVTVIPSASDGHIGAVVATAGDRSTVLDTAYASVTIGRSQQPKTYTESQEKVQRTFEALLDSRPPVPISIVVYFDLETDELGDYAGLVRQLREEISRRASAEVTVIGHTDRAGDDSRNDVLSARRAQRVRDQLVDAALLAPDLITVVARGEREPLVPTPDGLREPRNRRVEINIR